MRGRQAGVAALAAAVTLVGAAAALSVGTAPGKGAFLGRGSIEASFHHGFHPELAWINLGVSKDGRTVTGYASRRRRGRRSRPSRSR